ncbi:MAG: TonB-dependent receptor [Aliidongia sp.]
MPSKRNISQEIRLTSPDDTPLRYTVGAYYLSLNERIQTTNGVDVNGTVSPGILGPGSNNPTLTDLEDQRFNTAYAVFGQLEYRFLTNFDLTGGLRYDSETTSDTSVAPPVFETLGAFDGEKRSLSFDALQPKVTLKYDALTNTSIYAVYSTGFRSGGFNQAGVSTIAAAAGDPLVRDQYPKETTINYELGFKARLPGYGVSVQGSAYHSIVSDQQYYSFVPAASSQIISSIEKVHIDGAELETSYRIDEYLQASLGLAWTNAVIEADSFSPGDVGHQAPYVPKNQINLTVQYERPIVENLTGLARIDYERKGSQFWDTDNSTTRNPINLVNMRVALETQNGWTVGAWVKNLFDVRYNEEYDEGGFAFIAEPRDLRPRCTMQVLICVGSPNASHPTYRLTPRQELVSSHEESSTSAQVPHPTEKLAGRHGFSTDAGRDAALDERPAAICRGLERVKQFRLRREQRRDVALA